MGNLKIKGMPRLHREDIPMFQGKLIYLPASTFFSHRGTQLSWEAVPDTHLGRSFDFRAENPASSSTAFRLWSNSNKLINLDKCLWTLRVIVHQQAVRSNLSWLTAQEKERNQLCFPAALLFCRWCFSDFSHLNIETSISTNGRTTPTGFYKRQKCVLIVYLSILPECLSPASPEHHVFCDTMWQCLST